MNVKVNGLSLAVEVMGQGSPILFIHGFPLDRRMWRGQGNELAKSHQVIVPDLPGFGESAPPDRPTSMEDYADHLEALLTALDIHQPITLCGLSMGGYIAFAFFRRHRNRLARLVLCDTKATADPPEKRQDRERTAGDVLQNGTLQLARAMSSALLSNRTREQQPEILALVQEMIEQASPEGVAAASRAMASRRDATDLLPSIDVPTLVLCGEADAISPPAEMRELADAIPHAEFIEIPHGGHLAPLENPEPVNQALQRFCTSSIKT